MSNSEEQTNIPRYDGIVKWFSNKLGYGFIKVVDNSERKNDDIFVHQTKVTPVTCEYRTLRKGEYVSFEILPDEKNKWQANNVTGINGGPLLCDTLYRPNRREGSDNEYSEEPPPHEMV